MRAKPFGEISKGYTFFREGDVLFAKITPCMQNGKHFIAEGLIDGFAFGTTEFHVVRPGEQLDRVWLHFYLRRTEFLGQAVHKMTGAVGQQRLPPEFLADLAIPIPSLQEQRHLVAALKARRAAIEAAKKSVEHIVELCSALKKRLIDASFASEPATATARGWKWVKLGTIIESTRNGLYTPDSNYGPEIPILKMYNIGRFTGGFDLTRLDRVALDDADLGAFRLEAGDIVVNRVNSAELVAKSAIVTGREAGFVFESKNIRLRIQAAVANPSYICSALNNEFTRTQIFDGRKQIIGMATIDRGTLDNIEMALPSVQEQNEFVDRMKREGDAIEALRVRADAQLRELTSCDSALLRAAFSGAL